MQSLYSSTWYVLVQKLKCCLREILPEYLLASKCCAFVFVQGVNSAKTSVIFNNSPKTTHECRVDGVLKVKENCMLWFRRWGRLTLRNEKPRQGLATPLLLYCGWLITLPSGWDGRGGCERAITGHRFPVDLGELWRMPKPRDGDEEQQKTVKASSTASTITRITKFGDVTMRWPWKRCCYAQQTVLLVVGIACAWAWYSASPIYGLIR